MNKRSQAVLEFLSTYGWAILCLVVLFGALYYFDLLSPENAFANRCLSEPGFSCQDYIIHENMVEFKAEFVEYRAVFDAFVTKIKTDQGTIYPGDLTDPSPGSGPACTPIISVKGGENFTIRCVSLLIIPESGIPILGNDLFFGNQGEKARIEIELEYTPAGDDFPKRTTLDILGDVQAPILSSGPP